MSMIDHLRVHIKDSLVTLIRHPLTPADWKNPCWLALLVFAGISRIIGVLLSISLGVVVSNPPNGSKQTSIPFSNLFFI